MQHVQESTTEETLPSIMAESSVIRMASFRAVVRLATGGDYRQQLGRVCFPVRLFLSSVVFFASRTKS